MKQSIFFLMTMFLVSCGKHRDGTSVWAGGLWILPVVCLVGSAIFFRLAYKSSKSGSTMNPSFGGGEGGNVPIYKHGFFWFSVVLLVAAAVIAFVVNAEKG